jgi:eukaryotic-like serine/threonine-protein kinase
MIGRTIAERYRLTAELGRGATATIYLAERRDDGLAVAVKVLDPEIAADHDLRARFFREARVVMSLDHPGIVRLLDFGVDESGPFLVMEHVEGENLRAYMGARGKLPQPRAVQIALQIAAPLAVAHAEGVVHRDLKPENIMLLPRRGRERPLKLLDFGIAKQLARRPRLDSQTEPTVPVPITQVGSALGTPLYMAPEQALGRIVDLRVDIHGVGILLYEMLTGVVPYDAPTPVAVAIRLARELPAPPSTIVPTIHVRLEEVIMRCLAKAPDERWPSVAELRVALEKVLARLEAGELGARRPPSG